MSLPSQRPRWVVPAIWVIALGGFALPLLAYWFVIGRASSVTPDEARGQLQDPGASALLVDVCTPDEYAKQHIDGAVNWPHAELVDIQSPGAIPERFRGKRLYLICRSGIRSALAAQRLDDLGVGGAVSIAGGMQAWIASQASASGSCPGVFTVMSGEGDRHCSRASSLHEQWAAVLAGFVIKPTYMIFSLVLIIVLWRRVSPDLVALRRSMEAFLVGEGFCAANYLIYTEGSLLMEYLHMYGMIAAFGFFFHALLEGLDGRLVRLSDSRQQCAALALCGPCAKHSEAPCGMRRLFLFLIPAAAVVAIIPLCGEPQMISYNTVVLGTPYNYAHATAHQLFETYFCAGGAILLFAVAWAALRFAKQEPVWIAKVFFCAGAGALGFSLLRFFLFHSYRTNLVWFVFWEEATELLFVVSIAATLGVFRKRLLSVTA